LVITRKLTVMRKFIFPLTILGLLAVPFTSSANEVTHGTVIKKESNNFKPKKKKKKRGGHAGCEAYGRFAQVATR
jgi:hypothetical protein